MNPSSGQRRDRAPSRDETPAEAVPPPGGDDLRPPVGHANAAGARTASSPTDEELDRYEPL